jgi:hypothetical protein
LGVPSLEEGLTPAAERSGKARRTTSGTTSGNDVELVPYALGARADSPAEFAGQTVSI